MQCGWTTVNRQRCSATSTRARRARDASVETMVAVGGGCFFSVRLAFVFSISLVRCDHHRDTNGFMRLDDLFVRIRFVFGTRGRVPGQGWQQGLASNDGADITPQLLSFGLVLFLAH